MENTTVNTDNMDFDASQLASVSFVIYYVNMYTKSHKF